jgi:hypothetical protein
VVREDETVNSDAREWVVAAIERELRKVVVSSMLVSDAEWRRDAEAIASVALEALEQSRQRPASPGT